MCVIIEDYADKYVRLLHKKYVYPSEIYALKCVFLSGQENFASLLLL